MDPHTARCLQLSTSIGMPFNQYRPHQFPDANRSRFPVNAQAPKVRSSRSHTMPSNVWRGQPATNASFQQYASTARNVLPQQQYRIPTAASPLPPKSSEMDPAYIPSCMPTPDSQFMTEWDGAVAPDLARAGENGFDTTFGADLDQGFNPAIFSASTTGTFDDFVKSGKEGESWMFAPGSPDRRSWSELSTSSGGDDFTDMSDMRQLPSFSSDSLGLGFGSNGSNEMNPHAMHSRRRSSSRPPTHPGSRNRRYRSIPYNVNRSMTRSSSVSTTPPMSMPMTQCCSPLEGVPDDMLPTDFHGLDFSIDEHPATTDMFDTTVFYQPKPLVASRPQFHCDDLFMPPNFNTPMFHHGLANAVLPSSASDCYDFAPDQAAPLVGLPAREDPHAHYAAEPDLFGALSEPAIAPSAADLAPANTDLTPSEQELRFDGDLYTPRFVRGHGNKREGFCGICKPGRWLVLKNSAYWYDKSFTHGISAATGLPFDAPRETRRMSGNPDVWEGLCGCCNEWIALISNKKKGTTWFRHAYKCHTHQKAKDAPKRRRESSQIRAPKPPPQHKSSHSIHSISINSSTNNNSTSSSNRQSSTALATHDERELSPTCLATTTEEVDEEMQQAPTDDATAPLSLPSSSSYDACNFASFAPMS